MTRDTAERAREWFRVYPPPDAGWYVETVLIPGLADLLTQIQAEAREQLAAWMIEHSFSTGHGDTFEDLLKELDWQVKELRGQQRAFLTEQDVTEAYQSAPNWHSVLSSLNYRAIKNAALAQALQPEEKEGT